VRKWSPRPHTEPDPATTSAQRTIGRAAAWAEQLDQPPPGGVGSPDDVVPGEPADEPPGGGHDRRLTGGVVHRLTSVALAVELDEDPELGPGEVDERDELVVAVADLDLPLRRRHPRQLPYELHEARLEEAPGRRRARRAEGEDPADPGGPRRATPPHLLGRRLELDQAHELLAQRRLQGLLPSQVVEHRREVRQRLQRGGAGEAGDLHRAVRQLGAPAPRPTGRRPRRPRQLRSGQLHAVEAEQHRGELPAGHTVGRCHRAEAPVELGRRVGAEPVAAPAEADPPAHRFPVAQLRPGEAALGGREVQRSHPRSLRVRCAEVAARTRSMSASGDQFRTTNGGRGKRSGEVVRRGLSRRGGRGRRPTSPWPWPPSRR
jgi:hypothetical protein